MKQLLSLNHDFIIEAKFQPKYIKVENGKSEPDFVDETKSKANGHNAVSGIEVLVENIGMDGYRTGHLNKVWLNKSDIIALAKKIEEIEAVPQTGYPGDDLPF